MNRRDARPCTLEYDLCVMQALCDSRAYAQQQDITAKKAQAATLINRVQSMKSILPIQSAYDDAKEKFLSGGKTSKPMEFNQVSNERLLVLEKELLMVQLEIAQHIAAVLRSAQENKSSITGKKINQDLGYSGSEEPNDKADRVLNPRRRNESPTGEYDEKYADTKDFADDEVPQKGTSGDTNLGEEIRVLRLENTLLRQRIDDLNKNLDATSEKKENFTGRLRDILANMGRLRSVEETEIQRLTIQNQALGKELRNARSNILVEQHNREGCVSAAEDMLTQVSILADEARKILEIAPQANHDQPTKIEVLTMAIARLKANLEIQRAEKDGQLAELTMRNHQI